MLAPPPYEQVIPFEIVQQQTIDQRRRETAILMEISPHLFPRPLPKPLRPQAVPFEPMCATENTSMTISNNHDTRAINPAIDNQSQVDIHNFQIDSLPDSSLSAILAAKLTVESRSSQIQARNTLRILGLKC